MKTNRTELVFILDRSGSMSGLESDTIGGFNSMLEKQKKEAGDAVVTTVLFDNTYRLLHDRFDIHNVKPITESEYYVGGSTALLDAVGKTIYKTVNVQRHAGPGEQADKVMFVIITDGMENASREFTYAQIRSMIEHEKDKYGWEFIFLGANIDAESVAGRYGINPNRAVNYYADAQGVKNTYESINEAVTNVRFSKEISPDWKKRAERDFKERKK